MPGGKADGRHIPSAVRGILRPKEGLSTRNLQSLESGTAWYVANPCESVMPGYKILTFHFPAAAHCFTKERRLSSCGNNWLALPATSQALAWSFSEKYVFPNN